MNLVKWLRKNNKKLMAVVVIVIMLGFIGGSYLQQLGQRRTGIHKAVAWLGNNKEITNSDLILAGRELDILKMVGSDILLRAQDLQGVLLGELLFSERRSSPELIKHIKQAIRVNNYRISDKQINDIYRRPTASNIYWHCLKSEAQLAGIGVSNEEAGNLLGRAIPQLTGATYSQLIGSIINRQGIAEKEILATFGKLLAVLEYARMICSSEDVTTGQIMQTVSYENETMDVNLVKFDSGVFAETQAEPSEEEMAEHFDRYKKFFAGSVSEKNPYGFGYKLADRVKLEYIAAKLDDVSGIVTQPTEEEVEEYYIKHREQFAEQVLSDANDPNSPLTERIKSYAGVASIISKNLLQNEINSKAERILREAKAAAESGFEDIDIESVDISAEQFAQMAGDYKEAAEELTEKYKIEVYAGQTGLLNAADIQTDEHLGRLYLSAHGYDNFVRLPRIVFAVDELGVSELGPFDVPKPRMYENIGPMKDISGQIMAVVRVIEAQKASEPEGINQAYGKSTLVFERDPNQISEDVYSVKEKVSEDLKKLAAMDTTKSKTEEFIALAEKHGWEGAIDKFNELYGQPDKQDEGGPSIFRMQNWTGLRRISREAIETLAVQSSGNPAAQFLVNEGKKNGQFIARLYSLVPQDSNAVEGLPLVLEFKPEMSCYVIKDISVKRLTQDEYEKIKGWRANKADIVQSQSMAAVHFNPENILKRMNFRWVREQKETSDANTPAESKGQL